MHCAPRHGQRVHDRRLRDQAEQEERRRTCTQVKRWWRSASTPSLHHQQMSSQDDLGDEIDDTEAALHRCHLAVFLLDSSRRRSRFHAHSLNAVRYLADSFANQSVDASLTCNSSVFYVQSFSAPAADPSNFVISNEHSIRTVQLNRST